MTRKRFDTAPQFNVDEEGLVIQQVAGSTAALLEIKDHSGSSLMTVSAAGEMQTAAPSTYENFTVTVSASLPQDTTIGTVSSTEVAYLDGVTSSIQNQLNEKAPLASPVFTGTPTAPTATTGTNTTQVATTEFVATAVSNLVDSSPAALDTLNELAAALGDDPNFASTVTTSIATKAPLTSPALTGTPTAPTAPVGTNTTQIATTAYVMAAIPVATVQDYAGTTEPDGWKFLNGQTLTNAQTLYPNLWATVPNSWRSGANIVLPDARGRVSVSSSASGTFNQTVGSTGGVESVTLTAAQSGVQSHGHSFTGSAGTVNAETQDHSHSGSTSEYATYTFLRTLGVAGYNLEGNHIVGRGDAGFVDKTNGVFPQHSHGFTTGGRSAVHNHTFTPSGTVSTHAGASATEAHTNLQPYIVLNKIIKVY